MPRYNILYGLKKPLLVLFLGVLISGCAIAVPIKRGDVYKSVYFENSPVILVADFKDTRTNKRDIGGVGFGYFVVDIDIASEINSKVLKRLAEKKFNIRTIPTKGINYPIIADEIKNIIRLNSSEALLLGELKYFAIPQGMDATLQRTSLTAHLFIALYDVNGKNIYQNEIITLTDRYFGLGTIGPAQELVKDSMESVVNNLFKDQKFINALSAIQNNQS